jgi:class 3 adenylate cyclase/pimeloyl-ACP methyl ester carboxylesterase
VDAPVTRYARSGGVSIAYQALGDGPFDLVFVPGAISHLELAWQVPAWAAFNRRLASFSRLIMLDKRGTGMSDRVPGAPTLETRMDDVRAVLDAVGSERAAVLGFSEGGAMATMFAATYPGRAWALLLCGPVVRTKWAPDFPHGMTDDELRLDADEEERHWGEAAYLDEVVRFLAPSLADEDAVALARLFRQSTSPGTQLALSRMNADIDVRDVLPTIRAPTLVLNRDDEPILMREGARSSAKAIPGARHVELPGRDHAPFAGDSEAYAREIEVFCREAWSTDVWEDAEPDRVLATVLFTDIVGSTAKAVELGDAAWKQLLAEHHRLIRRQLARFRGIELDTAGDGFFARFDGPARAIRAASTIAESVRELGLEIRAGLHTGECEVMGDKVGGIAVHIGARVAKEARAGEVLVSSTVKDLVAGSGISFSARGIAELKGIPGEWRLYSVQSLGR